LNELEAYIRGLQPSEEAELQSLRDHFLREVLPVLAQKQKKLEAASRRIKRLDAVGISKKNILMGSSQQRERRRPTTHAGMISIDDIDVRSLRLFPIHFNFSTNLSER
jgi:hypothetical protein